MVAEAGLIGLEHLPPKLSAPELPAAPPATAETPLPVDEKTALINALRQVDGNQSRAAALLGVSRVTVWHRMKKYGIDLHKLITT
jgi:transcriptional regulator of acetoin/glycerol metabolism